MIRMLDDANMHDLQCLNAGHNTEMLHTPKAMSSVVIGLVIFIPYELNGCCISKNDGGILCVPL